VLALTVGIGASVGSDPPTMLPLPLEVDAEPDDSSPHADSVIVADTATAAAAIHRF
jgi:hypothetical protein